MAAGIALGCLVPPVIHFFSGPLGPWIGGFIASQRLGGNARAVAIIALTEGAGLSGVVAATLGLMVALSGADAKESALPEWIQSIMHGPMGFAMVGGVFFYAALLGAVGAAMGAALSRKAQGTSPAPAQSGPEPGTQKDGHAPNG
jgi:hypothetical protein